MSTTLRVHYDGKVLVPDESLGLTPGQAFEFDLRPIGGVPYRELPWQRELDFMNEVRERTKVHGKRTWTREDLYE